MMLEPSAIRKLIEGVTEGPWVDLSGELSRGHIWSKTKGLPMQQICSFAYFGSDDKQANIAFVLALNPATVLAMCELIDKQRRLLSDASKFLDSIEGAGYGGMSDFDVLSVCIKNELAAPSIAAPREGG